MINRTKSDGTGAFNTASPPFSKFGDWPPQPHLVRETQALKGYPASEESASVFERESQVTWMYIRAPGTLGSLAGRMGPSRCILSGRSQAKLRNRPSFPLGPPTLLFGVLFSHSRIFLPLFYFTLILSSLSHPPKNQTDNIKDCTLSMARVPCT